MNDIEITKDYRITSDERQWILNKVTVSQGEKTKGERVYKPISYHSSLPDLVKNWCAIDLRTCGAISIDDLNKRIIEQNKIIEDLIDE